MNRLPITSPRPAKGGGEGIALGAPVRRADGTWVLEGTFRIAQASADEIDDHLHRALVIVVHSAAINVVLSPFSEVALFKDDEQREPGWRCGGFTLLLLDERVSGAYRGDYFVRASIGEHVSDAVTFRVG